MKVDISQVRAVILAGGKGTRLLPMTEYLPKPLIQVGGQPIIGILLKQLQEAGIRHVTICLGHMPDPIKKACGDGSGYGLSITYSQEDTPLGTIGPLGLIKDLTDPVLVLNGDLLTTLSIGNLIRHHVSSLADMTLSVHSQLVKIDFGVIERSVYGDFKDYLEKPTHHYEVSMGVNVIGARALKLIKSNIKLDVPDLARMLHEAGGKVACFNEECKWLDVGRPEDYERAQQEFGNQ